jgi:hypothetical protein
MTTTRLALGVATGVLGFGVGAGVYATAQNTNPGPRRLVATEGRAARTGREDGRTRRSDGHAADARAN